MLGEGPCHEPGATSIYSHVPFDQDTSFLIIGERTNANGSKKFREAMLDGDFDTCLKMATEQVGECFEEGWAHYEKQDWDAAIAVFDELLEDGEDGPSELYRERCLRYRDDPPPKDWGGVYVMTSK